MSADLATWEPSRISAGDRWLWERQDLSDYPATEWTLTYSLVNTGLRIALTATANGSYHRIDVAAATTAAYPAGRYTWAAYVTSGTDRRQVGTGEIEIRPNLAGMTSGGDTRSFARQMLDAIEAQMLGRATQFQSDMVSMQIAARGLQRDTGALQKLHDTFKAAVASELAADRMESGKQGARRFLVRM